MNNEENKKSLNNFSNDAVDGKNVMGGGFGDGFVDDGSGSLPQDPFVAPAFNGPEDPIGGGMGPIGGDPMPPVGPTGNLPMDGGPIDPHGPLGGHGPI
jgi:hypothetical protein